jgi:hypothetical protein
MYIWNWINAVNASRVVTGRVLSRTKVLWDGYVPQKIDWKTYRYTLLYIAYIHRKTIKLLDIGGNYFFVMQLCFPSKYEVL